MTGVRLELPRNQILVGDAAAQLATLPAASVDCVFTSPPYFGLRDYHAPGQIGLERHVGAWVDELVLVCRALKRVLKPAGAVWLNLGDSYAQTPGQGAPRRSLLLAPQRLAVALLADGWLVRNQVVWVKANPMPESVTNRLAATYEVVLLLTQTERYYFDLDAIRASHTSTPPRPRRRKRGRPPSYPPRAALPGARPSTRAPNRGLRAVRRAGRVGHRLGKNPGDVWRVATAGYRGGHFATFPRGLLTRPILATCPALVCSRCGMPWRRASPPTKLRAGCGCQAPSQPGVVCDPFFGAGTTAIAAEELARDWLGIELNPAYERQAYARITAWRASHEQQKANT